MVNVPESGSQKSPNFIRILSTKSTVSQKTKIGKFIFNSFQNITHLLGHFFFSHFWLFILVNYLSILSTKSTISQKIKTQKSENNFFIGYRTLRIFLDQKIQFGHFWEIYLTYLSVACIMIDSSNLSMDSTPTTTTQLKKNISRIKMKNFVRILTWIVFISMEQKPSFNHNKMLKIGFHFWSVIMYERYFSYVWKKCLWSLPPIDATKTKI